MFNSPFDIISSTPCLDCFVNVVCLQFLIRYNFFHSLCSLLYQGSLCPILIGYIIPSISYVGCFINKQDSFGRTPLHVSAAVNHSTMTEFLLQNNANIDARTFGDEQAAIHYAAKNGAAQALKVLLGYQANIDSLDANKKTPLQVCLRM